MWFNHEGPELKFAGSVCARCFVFPTAMNIRVLLRRALQDRLARVERGNGTQMRSQSAFSAFQKATRRRPQPSAIHNRPIWYEWLLSSRTRQRLSNHHHDYHLTPSARLVHNVGDFVAPVIARRSVWALSQPRCTAQCQCLAPRNVQAFLNLRPVNSAKTESQSHK